MKYALQPTQDDILHYAKGSESKAHKYISRAFKKGRWVYTYAKNKARGNAVTNKNGAAYSPTIKTERTVSNNTKGVTQYNPTIKTITPQNDIGGETVVIKNGHFETLSKALAENMTAETKLSGLTLFNNIMSAHRETSVTNRTYNYEQYSPTYKTSPKPYSPTIKTLWNGRLTTEYTGTNSGKGNVIVGKNHYRALNRQRKKKK